jgi:predicted phosphodiesterase
MKYLFSSLLFIAVNIQLHAKIIMTPYLQAVTSTSVYVMVECDKPDTVTVNYGLTPDYGLMAKTEIIALTGAKPVTYVHKVQLKGLLPGSKYYYTSFQGKSDSKGAAFYTAVIGGTPYRMVWMADCRTGTAVFSKISANMIKANPLVALYGGDLCSNSAYKSWKKEFFIGNQLDFCSQVPFFNTPGNHEGWGQNAQAFTQNPVSASGTQDYYSFDYGDVHVLSVNYLVPFTEGTPQYEFAKMDLENTKQHWKIVITHSPAYCSGGHGEDKAMIAMSKQIFEPNKVDLVLAGHSHNFQHNLVNGIHHMVVGSAGAPLYTPIKADYTVSQAKDYNFAVIDVSAEKIKVVVYNAEMEVLDTLEMAK